MPRKRVHGTNVHDSSRAEWLAEKLGRRWRYDNVTGDWYGYDGVIWRLSRANAVAVDAMNVAAKHLSGCPEEGIERIDNESLRETIEKLLDLGPATRAVTVLSEYPDYLTDGKEWDANPYLLGCTNGVVDLRTGKILPSSPDHSVTLSTGVNYAQIDFDGRLESLTSRAPEFWKFLSDVTKDDENEIDNNMAMFMLSWYGASLFGFCPQQKFVIMTGIGRNGKGTLKNALLNACGEYAIQHDAAVYMRQRFRENASGARADLMALRGKRLAFFSEPEGGQFNDELIKAHTGGDKITARPLFSNRLASWTASHSITFLVNDLPSVDDIGPSMGDRVLVADFTQRYITGSATPPDALLDEKLESEKEGILAALIWAAGLWWKRTQRGESGLMVPERVLFNSKEYMETNDPLAEALQEAFEVGVNLSCTGQAAYEAYTEWFARSGNEGEPLSSTKFGIAMSKQFRKKRLMHARMWVGVQPRSAVDIARREQKYGEQ